MNEFNFSGEESARFTRFAKCCLDVGIEVKAEILGRDPLTSRPVSISGKITDAELDRYIRYIVVEERNGIEFWVAGSNSTRSVAAETVRFSIENEDYQTLQGIADSGDVWVPRIRRKKSADDDLLWKIEDSVTSPNSENLELLLNSLEHNDPRVRLEAGLTLRAFSEFIRQSQRRQLHAESKIIQVFENITDEDTQCALAENLGYFGLSASVEFLSNLLVEQETKEHVQWAAAIALSRLPETNMEHLLSPVDRVDHEWTKVALVLALSRNAEASDRTALEPKFRELLRADKSDLILRYSCLGLSRFEEHHDDTAQELIAILGDDRLGVEVRGYAGLAITSALGSYNDQRVNSIKRILNSVARNRPVDMADPEAIWGVEFLAELASILEINEVSASLNGLLADHFDDWRAGYYTCMKHYELAESAVRRGAGEEAIIQFESALESLAVRKLHDHDLPAEAVATMEFRSDIVESRRDLQIIVGNWMTINRVDDLRKLAEEIQPVYERYRRYASAASIGADRQLVDRELTYIKNTSNLVAIIEKLINFDYILKSPGTDVVNGELIPRELADIIYDLERLKGQFKSGFAQSLHELVEKLLEELNALEDSIDKVARKDLLRLYRSAMSGVQGAFWSASWPMPGRACPVYGLGRAKFILKTSELEGEGSEQNPLKLPIDSPLVLNASVTVFQMAPGNGTKLKISYGSAPHSKSQIVPIVEGEYTCTLIFSEKLPEHTAIKLDIALEFQARDCTQKADRKSVFVIGV